MSQVMSLFAKLLWPLLFCCNQLINFDKLNVVAVLANTMTTASATKVRSAAALINHQIL